MITIYRIHSIRMSPCKSICIQKFLLIFIYQHDIVTRFFKTKV